MRKHLIIASYDGISTYYCGIGTTMQDTIASLNELVNSEKIKINGKIIQLLHDLVIYENICNMNCDYCVVTIIEVFKKVMQQLLPQTNPSKKGKNEITPSRPRRTRELLSASPAPRPRCRRCWQTRFS